MCLKKNIIFLFRILLFLTSYLSWTQNNVPPIINAVGNQAYCPLSELPIVTDFDIIDPDDTQIEAFYIQISSGYNNGEDLIKLTNSHAHSSITTFWNASEGKLTFQPSGSGFIKYTDLIAAVKDVVFISNSLFVSGNKSFSFTIGNANFLPSTGHYYEFVADVGIIWTDAKVAAETRTYFGLQGYLATITSTDEAQLSGEQATGAGWIGGSDAASEGVWKWETGPETGTVFWNGLANGSTPNFAFWNTGEPNQLGNEDYAHITAPTVGIVGSWNDLSNTGELSGNFQPKGYIVEYGGTPGDPEVNISASTDIFIPEISSTTPASRCGVGSVTLSATSSPGTVLWFSTASGGIPLHSGDTFTSSILTASTSFYVMASENGCLEGSRIEVVATINEIPLIETDITFKNCDEDGNPDGFTDFNLNEVSEFITFGNTNLEVAYYLSFSDANMDLNRIDPSPFNNSISNTIYARVENNSGCYSISTVNIQISSTSFPPNFIIELDACDDDDIIDGYRIFDLTQTTNDILSQFPSGQNLIVQYYKNAADALLEQNEILSPQNYTNEVAFSQTLFVRVESQDNGDCFGIGAHLLLTVYPRPEFEVTPTATLCLNLGSLILKPFNAQDNYSYIWIDENNQIISTEASVSISSNGIYTIVATSNYDCESIPKSVTVKASNIANISLNDLSIRDDSENNTISIDHQNLGIGDYEFALDDINGQYQIEPLFENVPPGVHILYVREQNNCGIIEIEVAILGFPKFFTPNNDGYNDMWQVKGFNDNSYDISFIYIYNRFGKVLAKLDTAGEGWDGRYKGKLLPSTDYWFSAQLIDKNGVIRNRRGHFSLIRR